jgi:hypothetical protein
MRVVMTGFRLLCDSMVLAASEDSAVRLWAVGGDRGLIHTFRGHTADVNAVASGTPAAGSCVTGGSDGKAILWDLHLWCNTQEYCARLSNGCPFIIRKVERDWTQLAATLARRAPVGGVCCMFVVLAHITFKGARWRPDQPLPPQGQNVNCRKLQAKESSLFSFTICLDIATCKLLLHYAAAAMPSRLL